MGGGRGAGGLPLENPSMWGRGVFGTGGGAESGGASEAVSEREDDAGTEEVMR